MTNSSGKIDLEWYWAKRNEQEEDKLRIQAIKKGRDDNSDVIFGEYTICRARLRIDGKEVEGGFSVFKSDKEQTTVIDIDALLIWLEEQGEEIEGEEEDIENIKSLWDVPEEDIVEYITRYEDKSGSATAKSEFAKSYGELVDLMVDGGGEFKQVMADALERADQVDAAAAAAAVVAAADAVLVSVEDQVIGTISSSEEESESDDETDEDEPDKKSESEEESESESDKESESEEESEEESDNESD